MLFIHASIQGGIAIAYCFRLKKLSESETGSFQSLWTSFVFEAVTENKVML